MHTGVCNTCFWQALPVFKLGCAHTATSIILVGVGPLLGLLQYISKLLALWTDRGPQLGLLQYIIS